MKPRIISGMAATWTMPSWALITAASSAPASARRASWNKLSPSTRPRKFSAALLGFPCCLKNSAKHHGSKLNIRVCHEHPLKSSLSSTPSFHHHPCLLSLSSSHYHLWSHRKKETGWLYQQCPWHSWSRHRKTRRSDPGEAVCLHACVWHSEGPVSCLQWQASTSSGRPPQFCQG